MPTVLLLFFVALAGVPAGQLPASMPAGDAGRQFQSLMEDYYRAYARKDLAAVEGVCHPDGPARNARNVLQVEFDLRDATFERVRLSDVAIDAGGGRARAVIDLLVTDRRGTASRRERRVRDLTFLPHNGAWRLWNEASAGRSLAIRGLSVPSDQLDGLLAAEPELVSDEALAGLGTEAMMLRTRGQAGEALRATELRLRLARAAGHEGVMASCLSELGLQHQLAGRYADAGAAFREARPLVERMGTPRELATADLNVAAIEYLEGRYDAAIPWYERALRGFEAEGDRVAAAGVLHSLGNAQYMLGEYEQALEWYGRSGRLNEEGGNKAGLAAIHLASGLVHKELGNYREAAAAYRNGAAVADTIPDPVSAGRAWQGLGEVHRLEGDFAAALESLGTSLVRWERTADVPGKTAALFATGQVHAHLRHFPRAVEWYERALEADRAIRDEPGIARDLGGLGGADLAMGRIERAQAEYEESLALREKLDDRRGVMWTLVHLAALHGRHGRTAEAIRLGQRAVGEAERIGDRPGLCTAWAVIAGARATGDDIEAALASAARAAVLAAQVGQFDVLAYARTLSGKAHARAGRTADAQAALEEAVSALAQVPAGPGADVFFDDPRAPYLALVELLAGQDRAADAFDWLERGRQHLVAVMLGEDGVLVRKGLTAAERDEELRLLRAARSVRVKLQREELRDRPGVERQAGLREQRDLLAAGREALRQRLFSAHPDLRGLRAQADPTGARPALALGPREAALAYSVGESALRIFVVTPTPTPAGSSAPRIDVLTVQVAAADLAARVARFREAIVSRDAAADPLAADLHHLLIAPARAWLSSSTRLLIAPDGFLWGLPFEALRSPSGRYLVEDASVSYVPSIASVGLYRTATRLAARPRLVALAAPVIPADVEERIAFARPGPVAREPAGTALEARSVAAFFGPNATILAGADATAGRLAAAVPEGGVVHVAAPALVNDASPFYSCLVLSPAAAAEPESGLVEAATVMSWNLPGGLAVLSQAEAIQPRPTGEALTAWSWSFLAAGTPTLAISRWTAPRIPARTDPLVRAFYRELLRPAKPGQEPRPSAAVALQRATRRLLAAPATRHPWHWARMMVVGR